MFSPTGRPASRVSPIAAMGDKFYKTRSETDQSGKRAVAKKIMISNGWGTWIRTKIDGVRVRCSTVELSPNGRLKARLRALSVARQ
jgi:hypothetical protein